MSTVVGTVVSTEVGTVVNIGVDTAVNTGVVTDVKTIVDFVLVALVLEVLPLSSADEGTVSCIDTAAAGAVMRDEE